MKNIAVRLLEDENGGDLIEYALMAAIVALGTLNGLKTLDSRISTAFKDVGSNLKKSI